MKRILITGGLGVVGGHLDLILENVGIDDRLVEYKEAEPFTTKDKKVDRSKAVRELKHAPEVPLAEGVARTVAWMRRVTAAPAEPSR